MIKISQDINLSTFNTLGLQSQAKLYAEIAAIPDIELLIQCKQVKNEKWHILGGGSNLVLPEKINGLVIRAINKGMCLAKEDADFWYVTVQAGDNWDEFVMWCLQNSYYGLENLSLIPGTVGAAPIQNIGAYGVEVKDYFWELQAIDLKNGSVRTFTNNECTFAYRDSFFKQEGAGHYFIWDVTFRLPKKNKLHLEYGDISKELERKNLELNPLNISKAVVSIRTSKLPDPKIIGNAGSFFKNPIVSAKQHAELKTKFTNLVSYPAGTDQFKLAAGWLIEQAGWKGKNLGPVGMYEKQALVLVNHGGATALDVWKLATLVSTDVKSTFGIEIEAEPIRW